MINDTANFSAQVETISPELARAYLGYNTKNRRLKDNRVKTYARDMVAGNWRLTGEAIKFDTEGRLIDGQNRLHAVIEANVSVQILVIRNVASDAMDVMDSGAVRSAADALTLRGMASAKDIAAVAQVHAAYHGGRIKTTMQNISGSERMTNVEVVDYVNDHANLVAITPIAKPIANVLRVPVGAVATVYLEAMKVDEVNTEDFFARIVEMKTAGQGDPIATLLRRLAADSNHGHRIAVGTGLYLLIRTWNAFITGESLLRFQLGSAEGGWTEIPAVAGLPKRARKLRVA